MTTKPKFNVGEVVLCWASPFYEFVQIASVYKGRTNPKGKIRTMYVIASASGRSTTATASVLRKLTKSERGVPDAK